MRAVFTLILVLSAVFTMPVFSKGITNPSTLFDLQQLYGQKVQAKTAASKHLTSTIKPSLKTIKPNKTNFFKNKSFNANSSKAALKQFQVQFKFGNSYNVQQFGAKGDGVTDDQAAINQAIARATGTGLSVYFPPGNYLHSGLIVSNGVALYGVGSSTILTATDNTNGAIELTGNGPSLSNLVVQYANPAPATTNSRPDPTPQAGAIWVQSANSYSVTNVSILNSSENNIDIFQSNNGNVSSNKIITTATMFDGIQIVDCINLQVLNNNFSESEPYTGAAIDEIFGAISSQNLDISYNQINLEQSNNQPTAMLINALLSSEITHNVINTNNTNSPLGVLINGGNSGFYGLTSNVVVSDNYVTGTVVYSFVNDQSGTNNFVTNIAITNNTIIGDPNLSYGFYIQGGSNINFSSNALVTSAAGFYVYGGVNIIVQSNTVTDIGSQGIVVLQGDSVTIQSNTVSNTNTEGIQISNGNGNVDSVVISNNNLSNCCTGSGNVIDVEPANGYMINGLSIQNNNYAGPANNATYYIQSLVPGSATNPDISGNTQATALPNNLSP